ncbi:MAG TPA: dihydrofolate reductase family protein [Solirubrobacteraceae bacterium]|jgi:riboflavin biosynthesis pyrimidine reductase|nr:dihydrofolate reductase family protein [Solirubrobacteraceae bacterium]
MDVDVGHDAHAAGQEPVRFARLQPAEAPATAAELVEQLGLWERRDPGAQRPRVMLNMISTVDGRASLDGRSGPLGGAADRALFHALRGAVDAVLVGAGTVRTERYGRIIPDAARRALRAQRGLSEEPLACIVSGRLALDGEIPLLREPDAHVVILTVSAASLPATDATVEYVRAAADGRLDLAAALGELRARFDVRSLLCEGGPHLAMQLLEAGLLDELFLSLSPLLAGGEPAGGEALRILAGAELQPPASLELLGVLASGPHLFLRYGVLARERVSRETMLSSSLAS